MFLSEESDKEDTVRTGEREGNGTLLNKVDSKTTRAFISKPAELSLSVLPNIVCRKCMNLQELWRFAIIRRGECFFTLFLFVLPLRISPTQSVDMPKVTPILD